MKLAPGGALGQHVAGMALKTMKQNGGVQKLNAKDVAREQAEYGKKHASRSHGRNTESYREDEPDTISESES